MQVLVAVKRDVIKKNIENKNLLVDIEGSCSGPVIKNPLLSSASEISILEFANKAIEPMLNANLLVIFGGEFS